MAEIVHKHGACCCAPNETPAAVDMRETDPVCGMKVERATAKHRFS